MLLRISRSVEIDKPNLSQVSFPINTMRRRVKLTARVVFDIPILSFSKSEPPVFYVYMFVPVRLGFLDPIFLELYGDAVKIISWLCPYKFQEGWDQVGVRSDLARGNSSGDTRTTNN